jgi:hypothetical protein
MPSSQECQRQVQRILQSSAFRNALTLQQLLQFLAVRALNDGSELLKEYTIGVEAFGRSQDFDPKTDTIVRVQIHRLRQKLNEYYESDGQHDQIFVDIPKGHYLPRFRVASAPHREPEVQATDGPAHGSSSHVGFAVDQKKVHRGRLIRLIFGAASALLVCFLLGLWIGVKHNAGTRGAAVSVRDYAAGADPVKAFWAGIIGNDPTPVIAYPDAVFLLDNSNDLFRFRQGASDDRGALVDSHLAEQLASNPTLVSEAGALYYENGYTGAGELQAVAMLSGLFGQMGIQPIIKPSHNITPDDLRLHSVILLGSSFQNVAVAHLVTAEDFSFRNPDTHLEQWRAEIVNAHLFAGEQASYRTERDPVTRVLKADYAIVSIQAGVVPGRRIVMLGGLDTTGTEGAAMFVTSISGVEELQKAVPLVRGQAESTEAPQFQALVRVGLEKGYEVLGASLVAVHRISTANPPVSQTNAPSAQPK